MNLRPSPRGRRLLHLSPWPVAGRFGAGVTCCLALGVVLGSGCQAKRESPLASLKASATLPEGSVILGQQPPATASVPAETTTLAPAPPQPASSAPDGRVALATTAYGSLAPLAQAWSKLPGAIVRHAPAPLAQIALTDAGPQLIAAEGRWQPASALPAVAPAQEPPSPSTAGFARGRAAVRAGDYWYWLQNQSVVGFAPTSLRSNNLGAQATSKAGELSVRVLAKDAVAGSRVAALAHPTLGTWVAYIAAAREQAGTKAKLWWPDQGGLDTPTLDLCVTGGSALSVALSRVGSLIQVWTLEARLGTSAVHLRQFNPKTPRLLSEDRVVWVGGTTQPETEINVTEVKGNPVLLIALERDASRFGLAAITFKDRTLSAEPDVTWLDYKNGLTPAAIATGSLCGVPAVVFARPASREPYAPVEVVLGGLGEQGVTPSLLLDTARKVRDIAFYDATTSGLVAYTTDQETRWLTLPCVPGKK